LKTHVIKYDLYVEFPRIFAHNLQICAKNSVVKISMMFDKYFAYYTIIIRGGGVFSWTRCILKKMNMSIITTQEKNITFMTSTFDSEVGKIDQIQG